MFAGRTSQARSTNHLRICPCDLNLPPFIGKLGKLQEKFLVGCISICQTIPFLIHSLINVTLRPSCHRDPMLRRTTHFNFNSCSKLQMVFLAKIFYEIFYNESHFSNFLIYVFCSCLGVIKDRLSS